MNAKVLIVACMASATLGVASSAPAQQDQLSMDYWGFIHGQESILFGLGFVPVIEPPLVVDLENYQYTWVIEGVVVDSFYIEDEIEHYFYTGGTFKVYEDTTRPWNAVYDDTWCPDSTYISDPETFQDGELFLLGEMRYLNLDYYAEDQFGDYEGTMDLTGGSHLGDIPETLREGWTFSGTIDQPGECIPGGYDHRWDGQLFLADDPTPARQSTWSRVKCRFK